jgi:hypothetical protein
MQIIAQVRSIVAEMSLNGGKNNTTTETDLLDELISTLC